MRYKVIRRRVYSRDQQAMCEYDTICVRINPHRDNLIPPDKTILIGFKSHYNGKHINL